MSRRYDETTVRSLAVEYWQGELPETERVQIDQYLSEHPKTALFYSHVSEVLQAAKELDPDAEAEDWFRSRGGAVREGLVKNLGLDQRFSGVRTSKAAPVIALFPKARAYVWVGAAAAVTLLAVGLSSFGAGGTEVAIAPQTQDKAPLPEADAPAAPVRSRAIAAADFQGLTRQSETPEGLTLFASPGADYAIKAGAGGIDLRLERGTLLGEYIADGHSTLSISAPGKELVVVGTVFYVSTEETATRTGVALGAVMWKTETADRRIESGFKVDAEDDITPIPAPVITAIGGYIDLAAHEQKLADARQATNEGLAAKLPTPVRKATRRPRRTTPPAQPVVTEPTASEQAYAALAKGHHAEAAALLERAIAQRGAHKSRYLMLDLIRLYTNELSTPEKATPHARTFLHLWPTDPQAAQIRERLGDRIHP